MQHLTLGQVFRNEREARGWTPQQCAAAADYDNVDKGANRLMLIERGQDRFPDEMVWSRFAHALGISRHVVRAAIDAEFDRLDAIHCEPMVIVKAFAGFYYRHEVSEYAEGSDLLEFAKGLAREQGAQTCIVHSPVRCTYVEPDGQTFESTRPPFMRFG